MATYRAILEQNPSSILMSEPIESKKWVVENFDFVSPGLLYTDSCFSGRAGFSDLSPSDEGWSQNPAGTVLTQPASFVVNSDRSGRYIQRTLGQIGFSDHLVVIQGENLGKTP